VSAGATAFVLHREHHALEVVRELNDLLAESLDLGVLLPRLLERVQQHFGVNHATILLAAGEELEVAASIGANAGLVGTRVPMRVGIVGVAAARKRTINIGNVRVNRRYLGAMTGGQATGDAGLVGLPDADSQIAVPLVVADELMGVFLAESLRSAVFTDDDAALFSVITTPIAGAVRNAQMVAALARSHEEERAARLETERVLENLQAAQDALVASEKLAGLGQLAAGIAHEVNTPLGAILASLGPLQSMTPLLRQLLDRQGELDEDSWVALLAAIEVPPVDVGIGTSEAERALSALEGFFDEVGLDDADEYADMMVETGLTLDVPELQTLLDSDIDDSDLHLLYRVRSLGGAVRTIDHASQKAAKVVRALKAYAHRPSSEDERIPTSLKESVNVVLTMYQNVFKHGIEVQLSVDSDEPVLANQDQLLQVWTNILHNANDAMAGRGRMRIEITSDAEHGIVHLANDGPRIPDDVVARLFEAFYTTKAVGQGTGLGLHLCEEIVAAHAGTISVDTNDDWTTFTVAIPRALASA